MDKGKEEESKSLEKSNISNKKKKMETTSDQKKNVFAIEAWKKLRTEATAQYQKMEEEEMAAAAAGYITETEETDTEETVLSKRDSSSADTCTSIFPTSLDFEKDESMKSPPGNLQGSS